MAPTPYSAALALARAALLALGLGAFLPAQAQTVVAIEANGLHSCAITAAGGVKCWGWNFHGQIGDGTTIDRLVPVDVTGLASGVIALAAGNFHTCALTSAGGVKCWGDNDWGQLGDGSNADRHTAGDVPGLTSGVTAISSGDSHTCAITVSGGLSCWGDNAFGQVGDGSSTHRNVPVQVIPEGSGVLAVSAGWYHTCAITAAGGVLCWGDNGGGQLGDGTHDSRLTPGAVQGLASGVSRVSLGARSSCVVTTDGAAKCWGNNENGQLGNGTTDDSLVPGDVVGLGSGVADVAATGTWHSCALMVAGGVKCWGDNPYGQLGDGTTTQRLQPVDVVGLSGVTAITAGGYHTCAYKPGEPITCWGANNQGQIGDGSIVNRPSAAAVTGLVAADSADSTPDAFAFPSRTGVVLFGPQVSDPVTPTGYNAPAPITVANGTYSIGCGFSFTYTSAAGTINPGQSVCVQHNAAATAGASVTTTLTIGGVSGTFTTTTAGAAVLSLTPPSLDFGNQQVGTTSAGLVATLANTGAANAAFLPASVSGDFSVASTTCATNLAPGASCTITVAFAPAGAGARAGTLTVPNFINPAAIALVGTGVPDTTPDAFTFTSRTGVAALTTQTSDPVTPTGYNGVAPVTVANGEYSIGCTATFTGASGSITPGQSVCVRHLASATNGGSVTTTLTIGGVSATFTSTTASAAVLSLSPASLDFGSQGVGMTSAGQVATLSNTGASSAGLLPPTTTGDFSVASTSCGVSLAAGSSCAITVTFTPAGTGVRNGTLNISSFQGTPSIGLTGTGQNPGDVAAIAAGEHHTCGLTYGGGAKCWGANSSGELGDNSKTQRLAPVGVFGLASGVVAITAADSHTCALTASGGVKCWGDNAFGELGDNSTTQRSIPVDVSGLASGVVAVSSGGVHNCALTTSGGVKCWGANGSGELGDGSTVQRNAPIGVVGLASGIVAITTGSHHSCALTTGGGVKCWGSNFRGQLGDNSVTNRPTPVDVVGLASGVAAISGGLDHTCALTTAGGVKCWGSHEFGQIGYAFFIDSHVPIDVTGLGSGAAAITTGRTHSCALLAGGGVKCWGSNSSGEIGDGTQAHRYAPVDVTGLPGSASTVAAGGNHTCAVVPVSGVLCWGANVFGELGDGTISGFSLTPVGVVGLGLDTAPAPFTFPSRTGVVLFGLQVSDAVTPTGYNAPAPVSVANGGFSIGCTTAFTTEPEIINPGQTICVRHFAASVPSTSITTTLTIGGVSGTFTTTTAGAATLSLTPSSLDFGNQTIGTTSAGQIATLANTGASSAAFLPPSASGDFSVTSTTCATTLAAGASCTITVAFAPSAAGARIGTLTIPNFINPVSSALTGTGAAAFTQLSLSPSVLDFGNQPVGATSGTLDATLTNTGTASAGITGTVTGDFSIIAENCGASLAPGASCKLTLAFSPTSEDELGGALTIESVDGQTLVRGLEGVGFPATGTTAAIAVGYAHGCALSLAGAVKCWGSTTTGDGTTPQIRSAVGVPGLDGGVVAITAGDSHACALTSAGGVKCWGKNDSGQLGDASFAPRPAPVDVIGLASGVSAIAAGANHTCALRNNGSLLCWGSNQFGQLGDNTSNTQRSVPGDVLGLASGVVAVSAGHVHTCALTTGGGAKCWGNNGGGQLGDDSFTHRLSPVSVAGMASGVVAISASYVHTCALRANGAVACWGVNDAGQLGNSDRTTARATPTPVTGLDHGIVAIETGQYHSCAISVDSTVRCWGRNVEGQLGDGSGATLSVVPTTVIGLGSGIASVSAGAYFTCAVATGAARCWGSNIWSELGDNSLTSRIIPVSVAGLVSNDGTPAPFAFPSRTGVVLFGPQVSDPVIPTGYDLPAPISVANGTYSIGCGLPFTYTSAAGTINPGQSVCVQHNAAATAGASVTTTLTIGGVSGTFTTTTAGAAVLSLTPASLAFASQAVGTTSLGKVVVLTNSGESSAGVIASITAEFTMASQTCSASIPANSSCTYTLVFTPAAAGVRNGTFQILNGAGTYSVSLTGTGTVADASTPSPFTFPAQTNVPPVTDITSSAITPTGYTVSAAISVDNGKYSIGCGTTFTDSPGTINPGQSVCVRHTSALKDQVVVSTRLTIGAASGTFRSTTANDGAEVQSIDFASLPDHSVKDKPFALTAKGGGSGNPVTFISRSPLVCTVSGSNVTPVSVGTCVIVAQQEGNASFSDAPEVVRSFAVVKEAQVITFGLIDGQPVGTVLPLSAATSSNLKATFTSLTIPVCTVAGTSLTLVAAGTCTVAANQAGNEFYDPAPEVQRSFAVTGAVGGIARITAGFAHSCALTTGGGVRCWGDNTYGQLGDGSTERHLGAAEVPSLSSGVAAISAGGYHTCALTTGGGVKCWGYNATSQIGDGTETQRETPVDVVGLASGVTAIAAGEKHTCALMAGGQVKCWGLYSPDNLGDNAPTPVAVPNLASDVAAISAGNQHTCVLTTGGAVKCWGDNSYGQAGDAYDRNGAISGLAGGASAIAAGRAVSCALTTAGGVKCWGQYFGFNSRGDPIEGLTDTPLDVDGLASGVAAIAAADINVCALTNAGAVKCGPPIGFVGDVTGLGSGVAAIAVGYYHACALTTAGRVKCWGRGTEGQLGDNSGLNRLTPVEVQDNIDATPQPFAFATQAGVFVAEVRTSNTITPAGFSQSVPITVSVGEYSIGCSAAFTTAAGIFQPGQSVCVRHVASGAYATSVRTTLTIGGVAGTFTSTTGTAPSLTATPGSLTFGEQAVGTTSTARQVTVANPGGHPVTGVGSGVNGDFAIASTTCTTTLAPNASCTLSLTFTPLALGGRSGELLVYAANTTPSALHATLLGTGTASDTTPDAFTFVDQFLVPTNTVATSAPVRITGVSGSAPVSVIGGTYAISVTNDCSGSVQAFTANPGLIANGQYVCVRHTTSAVPGGSNDTQLIVGGLGDTFTTVTIDPVPAPFVFAPLTAVAQSSTAVSAAAVITGINTASPVTVSGGEYSIGCTGAFTQAGSTVVNGQSVCVRHNTAAAQGASTTTTLTIGGVAGNFTSTTALTTANLAVSQAVSPATPSTGKDVVYTITASNIGTAPIAGVTLTDLIPAGTTFIWASPGCTNNVGTVTCPVGTLAAGASVQRKVVVRPTVATPITNTATVAGAEQDIDAANNASNAPMPVSTSPAGASVLRYRLFSPISSEHLYTTDLNEYTVLGAIAGVWIPEGTVGKVLNNPGTYNGVTATPYYRLYNTSNAQHHWTTDPNEYYTLILFPQYSGEGVDGYLLPTQAPGSIPLYRLLYPFSVPVAGLHHWTIDPVEYNALIASFGWIGEGGSGFVIP